MLLENKNAAVYGAGGAIGGAAAAAFAREEIPHDPQGIPLLWALMIVGLAGPTAIVRSSAEADAE